MDTSRIILGAGLLFIAVWAWASGDRPERQLRTVPPETATDVTRDATLLSDGDATHPPSIRQTPKDELAKESSTSHASYEAGAHSDDNLDDNGRAHFHPHGDQVCASGCAVSNHPTEQLTQTRFEQLLEEYAAGPLDGSNLALETLLFFGPQSADFLADQQASATDAIDPSRITAALLEEEKSKASSAEAEPLTDISGEHLSFLEEQLRRHTVKVAVHVMDEDGILRAELPPTRVPLDRRHIFKLDVNDLQPLVVSGTVKRVGLDHLWTRL